MTDLPSIRIMESYPGRVAKYTVDMRFVDVAQGTHETEFGWSWNYDKGLSFGADTLEDAAQRAGDVITGMLCRDQHLDNN
jgi:hypothetical protein